MQAITEEVYKLLENQCHLRRVYIPVGSRFGFCYLIYRPRLSISYVIINITKPYISHIPLKDPTDPIATKFGLGANFTALINCAKFHFNPFRSFDFVEGRNLAFPIGTMETVQRVMCLDVVSVSIQCQHCR